MKLIVIFLTLVYSSIAFSSSFEEYTVGDLVDLLGKDPATTVINKQDSCSTIPFFYQAACYQSVDKLNKKLEGIRPFINNRDLVYSKRVGKTKVEKDTYVKWMRADLFVHENTGIALAPNGLKIFDIHHPLVAKVLLDVSAGGDGKLTVDGFLGQDSNYDIDVDGEGQIEVMAAFTLNPRMIDTPDQIGFVFEPKFRLMPLQSNIDLDIDVDGGSWWDVINIALSSFESLGQVAIDLVADWGAIVDDLEDWGVDLALTIMTQFIQLDDMAGDLVFDTASLLTSAIADHKLDQETDRALYDQEVSINQDISDSLGLDSNGLLEISYPKSSIQGKAAAVIIAAIQPIL